MKRTLENRVKAEFSAKSENESLARVITAGFLMNYPVTTEELADVKTAVSEAVTNSVVHAYKGREAGGVRLEIRLFSGGLLRVTVADFGCGIADVQRAREPFFTTDREHERGGMGFSVMETFMDRVKVSSTVEKGTRVTLEKRLCRMQNA
ncbi:MAG: anti-sigma F factor [Clostridia bacterium]|nr:anti-sigma F factor [Clostridia bacterium]